MRFKVELHRDVVWDIRHRWSDDEVKAFYEQLDRVRADPIENSEAIADPKLSRYMLRFFRFAGNLAIFEFDPGRERVRILECRRLRIRPRARGDPNEGPEKACAPVRGLRGLVAPALTGSRSYHQGGRATFPTSWRTAARPTY